MEEEEEEGEEEEDDDVDDGDGVDDGDEADGVDDGNEAEGIGIIHTGEFLRSWLRQLLAWDLKRILVSYGIGLANKIRRLRIRGILPALVSARLSFCGQLNPEIDVKQDVIVEPDSTLSRAAEPWPLALTRNEPLLQLHCGHLNGMRLEFCFEDGIDQQAMACLASRLLASLVLFHQT
ncbi:hypothetical protein MKX08_003509 [Trichoderma sp. CBMAI-0020]|nr:hypothetical protein MKX08_003509 [Trichoderma sp. CBMAI-0020]